MIIPGQTGAQGIQGLPGAAAFFISDVETIDAAIEAISMEPPIQGSNQILNTLQVTSLRTFTVPDNVAAAVPTIASATTIAPTTPILFVSGTAAIATITPPPGLTHGGQITVIPTGLFTTVVTGNIALASAGVVNKALILTYEAVTAKWYPSY